MNSDFSNWLAVQGFSVRVQSDILSRLKRASTFINVDAQKREDSALMNLGRNADFEKLSTSVKSQIRRAVRLFFEFKSSV